MLPQDVLTQRQEERTSAMVLKKQLLLHCTTVWSEIIQVERQVLCQVVPALHPSNFDIDYWCPWCLQFLVQGHPVSRGTRNKRLTLGFTDNCSLLYGSNTFSQHCSIWQHCQIDKCDRILGWCSGLFLLFWPAANGLSEAHVVWQWKSWQMRVNRLTVRLTTGRKLHKENKWEEGFSLEFLWPGLSTSAWEHEKQPQQQLVFAAWKYTIQNRCFMP